MQNFHYQDDSLLAEQVPLTAIAECHGTPCYVYSRAALEARWRAFDDALAGLAHRICYSVCPDLLRADRVWHGVGVALQAIIQ